MSDALFLNYPVELLNQVSVLLGLTANQTMACILVLSMAVAFLALFTGLRKAKRLHDRIEKLQHDLLVTNSGAKGMGQQLIAMEKEILSQKGVSSQLSVDVRDKDAHSNRHAKVTPLRAKNVTNHKAPNTESRSVNKPSHSVDAGVPENNKAAHFSSLMNAQKEDDSDVAYDEVKDLLDQGFDMNHVIKKSGLSHAEVSLIRALHHKSPSNTHSHTL